MRRSQRLRTEWRAQSRAEHPVSCSECQAPVPAGPNKGFKTCGPSCSDARNARLKREKYDRAKAAKRRHCMDCQADITDEPGSVARRCAVCHPAHRVKLAEARRERQPAGEGPMSWGGRTARQESERRLNTKLRSLYGIGVEDFRRMQVEQDGLCAVCQLPPSGRGRGGQLVVDHCHDTGKVRGLLCGQCNIAIGLLSDSEERLQAAAAYLSRARA